MGEGGGSQGRKVREGQETKAPCVPSTDQRGLGQADLKLFVLRLRASLVNLASPGTSDNRLGLILPFLHLSIAHGACCLFAKNRSKVWHGDKCQAPGCRTASGKPSQRALFFVLEPLSVMFRAYSRLHF